MDRPHKKLKLHDDQQVLPSGLLPLGETLSPPPRHDIFLSHSGKQKGFARDLCESLCSHGHTVFFDENADSLPPGQPFPPHIFSAVYNCKVALIVLSDDFLNSKWPMMELCAAFDRHSDNRSDLSFTILPLFFKLSPADMRENGNVMKWRTKWMEFEKICDGRISVSKCEDAVTKTSRLSGVVRGEESVQGESSYVKDIVKRISTILRPRNHLLLRYGVDPDKQYVGRERLCKVIKDKFQVLEKKSYSEIIFLGMYGVPGSGKSTICDFMREYMLDDLEFGGKVIELTLPTYLRAKDSPEVEVQYVNLLSVLFPHRDFRGMNLKELYNLKFGVTSQHKMFLVLDNISPSNYATYKIMLQHILRSKFLGSGSRVMVVAQSSVILENLFNECKHNGSISFSHSAGITEVPNLTTDEAKELLRNQFPSIKDDLVTRLLVECTSWRSSMYIPFVFEQIGIFLRENDYNNLKELDQFWKMVRKGKKDGVMKLVDIQFKQLQEDLKGLFFDIALFIIPIGYSKLTDAIPILCSMHNITDTFELNCKIKDLKKHGILSDGFFREELTMHDIFIEYARSSLENSKYVNEPWLKISNLLVVNEECLHPRRIDLKFPEARAICIGTCHERSIDCEGTPLIAYDEEVCLHVEVGGTTRALLVRNKSKYSRCILSLSGNMSSLVCLETENVHVVFGGGDVIMNLLVRLELRNESYGGRHLQRSCEQPMSNFVFSTRQMTCLRVLHLINVDIRRKIEIVGSPVLEEIEIQNGLQDPMDVSIHRISKLKRLVIKVYDCYKRYVYSDESKPLRRPFQGNERKLELGLGDCLELEKVDLDRSFDRVEVVGPLPKKLLSLNINDFGRGSEEFIPTKWIGSSIHRLSALEELDLSWGSREINSLVFTKESFGGCLPALRRMRLEECESLTHLTLEPSCFPNLFSLKIMGCRKLQVLKGLEHIIWMEKMEYLRLCDLPQLQVECDLSRWNNYSSNKREGTRNWDRLLIYIGDCPGVKIYFDSLEAYNHLREIEMNGAGGISMVEKKDVAWKEFEEEDGSSADGSMDNCKCCSNVEESTIVASSSTWSSSCSTTATATTAIATTAAAENLNRLMFSEGKFTCLVDLVLRRVDHLREIEGIHHLPELRILKLKNLPNLTRISGTRWPTYIKEIEIINCPMLLEIPPFDQTLRNLCMLWCIECTALKAVEGFGESMEMRILEKWEDMRRPLRVYGSKFASGEATERWLRVSEFGFEFGSPLFKAAVEVLLWEHYKKGIPSALDTLHRCFSSIADTIAHCYLRHDKEYVFSKSVYSAMYSVLNKEEEDLFRQWFAQFLTCDSSDEEELEETDDDEGDDDGDYDDDDNDNEGEDDGEYDDDDNDDEGKDHDAYI